MPPGGPRLAESDQDQLSDPLAAYELPGATEPGEAPRSAAYVPPWMRPAIAAGADAGYVWQPFWWWRFAAVVALLVIGGIVAIAVKGPFGDFMEASLEVLPFAFLALLAYLGVSSLPARIAAYGWLVILLWTAAFFLVLLTFAAITTVPSPGPAPPAARAAEPAKHPAPAAAPKPLGKSARAPGPMAAPPAVRLMPSAPHQAPPAGPPTRATRLPSFSSLAELSRLLLWELLAGILAAVALLPPLRRRLQRWLPIDARSPVHAIALSLVIALTVMMLGQLIAARGRPVFLTLIQNDPEMAKRAAESPLTMLFGLVWTVPAALVAGGWPVVRTWRGAFQRLGLVRPTVRQVVGAVGLALLLVGAAHYLDLGVGWLFNVTHWPKTDEKAVEQLFSKAINRWGALAVGISAGVGEELVVRGALQPRLGILVSALFFASLHALQYGFDGLISVLALGLILGLVRKRSNTTCSAIVHGVYDFTLLLVAALGK